MPIQSRLKLLVSMVAVAVSFGYSGYLLYEARVLKTLGCWDTDFVVIYGPFWMAVLIGTWAIRRRMPTGWSRTHKLLVAAFASFLVAVVTAVAYFTIAFNRYGS